MLAPITLLVVALLVAGFIRASESDGAKSRHPHSQRPSPSPPPDPIPANWWASGVAVWINNQAILMETVAHHCTQRGQSDLALCLQERIHATLVLQEARRGGYLENPRASDVENAATFLDQLWTPANLCRAFGKAQYRAFYEATYQKDWPARLFAVDMLEVRCFDPEVPVSPEDRDRCMEENRPILGEFQRIRPNWEPGDRGILDELRHRFPRVGEEPFLLRDYTGISPEKAAAGRYFDRALREVILGLELGETSHPVTSTLGYHLIRLRAFRPAITPDSPAFREKADEALCQLRIQAVKQDYLRQLVAAAVVVSGELEWREERYGTID